MRSNVKAVGNVVVEDGNDGPEELGQGSVRRKVDGSDAQRDWPQQRRQHCCYCNCKNIYMNINSPFGHMYELKPAN
jgi:hypothetical protein